MNREGRPENNGYVRIRNTTKLAGVSTVTVPYTINNPEMTFEKVRKKVQRIIEEYNYIPDQPIKKIFSKTSSAIAVFTYNMENPFFISLIKELSQTCLEHNYMLLTCGTGGNPELEKKYLYLYLANRYADIILIEGVNSDIFGACKIHILIASPDRKTRGKFSSVRSNNRQVMQPIVDYLYDLGCGKIAFVDCRTSMDSIISRQNGYIEAVAGKGLPIIQEYIYDRNLQLTLQAESQALNCFFSPPAAPMVIIYCDGIITLRALNAAYSLGLRIPTDMSIVGFGNIISSLHQPQTTTMQQGLWGISLELFELVVNPPEKPVSKIIKASFIEGATYSRIETSQK